jgi:hypothetical protein
MADFEKKTYYCERCNHTMSDENFYTSNNLEKYAPDGKLRVCKKCATAHINNWDPDTYLWILQEIDVPYVPDEWNKLLMKYGQDRAKLTGMTILGRYLSKMKLKQYKDFRWEHTEFLQEQANAKIEQTMKRQGYDAAQIAEAVNKATFTLPVGELEPYQPAVQAPPEFEDDYFARMSGAQEEDDDLVSDLTEEDMLYLRLKWGKTYKPEEWVQLEKLYNEMMESYDIQSAGHIDTLKLVCKTSLKANQLIDIGDIEGFQKMSKVYDSLMKSGKFTAQQNKAEKGEYVDSISELVALCEKDGFIPRYHVDEPKDKVDRVLQDLQSYTRSLVMEEMNLGNLIENAVKQIEIDKQKEAENEAEAANDEELLEMELFGDDAESVLEDEDFAILRELEEEAGDADDDFIKSLLEDDE